MRGNRIHAVKQTESQPVAGAVIAHALCMLFLISSAIMIVPMIVPLSGASAEPALQAAANKAIVSNVRLGEQGPLTRLVIDMGEGAPGAGNASAAPQNVFTLAVPHLRAA